MVISSFLGGAAGGASVNIIIRATDQFSAIFTRAGTGMNKLGRVAGLFGVAVAAGLAFSIKKAIDFEDAFAGVRKTVELTEEEFGILEDRFRTLSTEIPVSFEELSSIGEIAGQLGVTGVENLAKFTKTVADISVTTNLTAEDAATSFARIANIMKEPLKNIDKMGSVVVELGNNFATTESEILTFSTRIASTAALAGISTSEIFGIATAFSAVGVQAEAGGTAVSLVFQTMIQSVAQGGAKLEEFARITGQTTEEFSKQFKTDAAGAFNDFVLGLGTAGDDAFNTLDKLGLGGRRTLRALTSLAGAGDLVTETLEVQNEAWEDNTALTIEANKRYETSQSKLTILKGKMNDVAAEVGDNLKPAFDKIIEGAGESTDEIKWLGTAIGNLVLEYAGLAAHFAKDAVTAVSDKQRFEEAQRQIKAEKGWIQDLMTTTAEEIQQRADQNEAHELYVEDMKKMQAATDLAQQQTEELIPTIKEEAEEIDKLGDSFNVMTDAAWRAIDAQNEFARVIGGKVYVGISAVRAAYEAKNIAGGYEPYEGVRSAEEKLERQKIGIITAPGNNASTTVVNIENVYGTNGTVIAEDLQNGLQAGIST